MQPIRTLQSHRVCSNRLRFCISVPPSCSTRSHRQGQDINTHGSNFGNSSENLSPMHILLCRLRSSDRLLVTSDLLPLVSAAVNGNLRRCCHHSELTAELGYEFDPFMMFLTPILSTKQMPCSLPRMRSSCPAKMSFSLDLIKKIRVRFPPDSSRTDRVVEISLTDLAQAIALALFGLTETCESV